MLLSSPLTYLVHFLLGSPDRRSEAFLEARLAFLSVAQLARNFTTPRRKPRDPFSRALANAPYFSPRHRPLSSCHLIIVVKPAGYPPKRSSSFSLLHILRFPSLRTYVALEFLPDGVSLANNRSWRRPPSISLRLILPQIFLPSSLMCVYACVTASASADSPSVFRDDVAVVSRSPKVYSRAFRMTDFSPGSRSPCASNSKVR